MGRLWTGPLFEEGQILMIGDIAHKFRQAEKKLILLDYDGTLVNFSHHPEGAAPDEKLINTLERLGNTPGTRIVIITGRKSESIDAFLGHLPLDMVAEHGAFLKASGSWIAWKSPDIKWRDEIKAILEIYVSLCPGSFLEEKKYTLTWHYRSAGEDEGQARSQELISELGGRNDETFRVIDGNKIVEATACDVDKGRAALELIREGRYDIVLCIGDDRTDEDMFMALQGMESCFTIKVGPGPTVAKNKLKDVTEVLHFLEELSE